MTLPSRIRKLATEHYGWEPGDTLTDVAYESLAARASTAKQRVYPSRVREVLAVQVKPSKAVPVAYVRLPERDKPVAIRLARAAGYETPNAWVQAWVEAQVRKAGER